ncbi:hypothetical protein C0992_005656 [Termitomyces sp. T32_za158]|nr:hypothetical protein C0992_005656 [Termitomyces sp. T32_za158]
MFNLALIGPKTMIRGYSAEGDKLLNYLENGIFDALQKEDLKSFIFAIYLNPNDLNDHPSVFKKLVIEHRFANLKLYYTKKAPVDYELPHFQPGDEKKDKWYFMTHNLDEVPDNWMIGKVNTGYHSVNLSVTSIVRYLPTSSLDNATYPNHVCLPNGTFKKRVARDVPEPLVPSGIRNNETGVIGPFCGIEEAHFTGVLEKAPSKLNGLTSFPFLALRIDSETLQMPSPKNINIAPHMATSHRAGIYLEETNKDTPTQMETQMAPPYFGQKQANPADHDNNGTSKPGRKKLKISVTQGLGLKK